MKKMGCLGFQVRDLSAQAKEENAEPFICWTQLPRPKLQAGIATTSGHEEKAENSIRLRSNIAQEVQMQFLENWDAFHQKTSWQCETTPRLWNNKGKASQHIWHQKKYFLGH